MDFNDPQVQMMLVSILAPVAVKLVETGLTKLNVVTPKPLKPVLSILLGALSAAMGDFSPAAGAAAGVAGIGVREVSKPVTKKVVKKVSEKIN